MDFQVMSRFDAYRYSLRDTGETCAMVSIRYPGSAERYPEVRNNIKYMLAVTFADVADPAPVLCGITDRDAAAIASFVNQYWGKVDLFVVHCDAGVSRSAGVAAAILKAKTGRDNAIFDNYAYRPNMLCYRRVLNALMEQQTV